MNLPKIKLTGTNILNIIGAIVIINLVVILAQTISRNYKLNQQIDALNSQVALLNDQKDQLDYSIQYYNTEAFRDREARAKLGLQQPGENVIIIPRTSPTPTPPPAGAQATAKRSNLQQWFDFLSGHKI
jgi:cell division protein FtsB